MVCSGCHMTFRDFYVSMYPDKEKIKKFLMQHGVILDNKLCSKCEGQMQLIWRQDNLNWRCHRKFKGGVCVNYISARKGTFVGNSKLSMWKIIEFCILWLQTGIPRTEMLVEVLNCSPKTVTDWSVFCREVCENYVRRNSQKIGGECIIVEFDEVKFGKRKHNLGRHVEGSWVFGAVERDNKKKFFVVPVAKRDKETLLAIIQKWILPGSIIISDCWQAYDCFNDVEYKRLAANHSLEYVNTGGSVKTHGKNVQQIEKSPLATHIQNTKRSMRFSIPALGRKKKFLPGYLAEYIFKSNHNQKERVHAFFLEAGILYDPSI